MVVRENSPLLYSINAVSAACQVLSCGFLNFNLYWFHPLEPFLAGQQTNVRAATVPSAGLTDQRFCIQFLLTCGLSAFPRYSCYVHPSRHSYHLHRLFQTLLPTTTIPPHTTALVLPLGLGSGCVLITPAFPTLPTCTPLQISPTPPPTYHLPPTYTLITTTTYPFLTAVPLIPVHTCHLFPCLLPPHTVRSSTACSPPALILQSCSVKHRTFPATQSCISCLPHHYLTLPATLIGVHHILPTTYNYVTEQRASVPTTVLGLFCYR